MSARFYLHEIYAVDNSSLTARVMMCLWKVLFAIALLRKYDYFVLNQAICD